MQFIFYEMVIYIQTCLLCTVDEETYNFTQWTVNFEYYFKEL